MEARELARVPFLLACLIINIALSWAAPLPEGNSGIAASYPLDINITGHPDVIFADDFESYTAVSQLWNNWTNLFQQHYIRIATDTGDFYSGAKAAEFRVPKQGSEVANALVKAISPEEILFVRAYTKFSSGYSVIGSGHNGIAISGNYCCPGVPADGTNKFMANVENSRDLSSEPSPGYTHTYIYHPEQRSQWGDHWYPDGRVVPYDALPGDFGPDFVQRENFIPEMDRWYCYELMVKANSPGMRDGRIAIWIDGNLIADWQNVRLRDTEALKIDKFDISLHVNGQTVGENKKWYDNVVAARSYIGPMSLASCSDECAAGSTRCDGAGYSSCGNNDSDPCLEWSARISCPAGQSCVAGACIEAPDCNMEMLGAVSSWKEGRLAIIQLMEAIRTWKSDC